MIHLAQFSGGKDSTAMVLHLKEQGVEFTPVFCDTGWEHPLTYAYVEEINQRVFDGRLVILHSDKYAGFEDMVVRKRAFPVHRMRFCTLNLKIIPLHAYIETLDDEVTSYVGERADESYMRARKPPRSWDDAAGGYWIERPLLHWSAAQCFEIAKRHGLAANPLYLMGAERVGCFPCINETTRGLRRLLKTEVGPLLRQRVIELERRVNEHCQQPERMRHFFPSNLIPPRFHSLRIVGEHGQVVSAPSAEDVFRYSECADEDQIPLFAAPKCMSVYNLCE